MNESDDKNWVSFEALQNKMKTPKTLEESIVRRLKEENLINSIMKQNKFYWMAAVLVGLIMTFFAGRYSSTWPGSTDDKSLYLLLLREDASFNASDIPGLVKEYSGWAQEQASKNQLASAEKLTDEAFTLGMLPAASGPGITGYFVIKANNLDQAMEIAKSHPHLKYNGGIELRPVDNFRNR